MQEPDNWSAGFVYHPICQVDMVVTTFLNSRLDLWVIARHFNEMSDGCTQFIVCYFRLQTPSKT